MKRKMVAVAVLMVVCSCMYSVNGEGLFPSFGELYTTVEMPSMARALDREPDNVVKQDDDTVIQYYSGIGPAEFDLFSAYLAQNSCSIGEYSMEDGVFSARIDKDGQSFTFVYDGNSKTAELSYPKGTKPEEYVSLKKHYAIGNIVTFGRYEQDQNEANGTEEIEWLVLDQKDNRALMISLYALDAKPFHAGGGSVTWEKSSLRSWLNNTFLDSAFNENEQSIIATVWVDNGGNQAMAFGSRGKDTQDKIYLLSYKEAWQYFLSEEDRQCAATEYAISQGAYVSTRYESNGKGTSSWWLRSAGMLQSRPENVMCDGSRNVTPNDDATITVRPVLWIDLDAADK